MVGYKTCSLLVRNTSIGPWTDIHSPIVCFSSYQECVVRLNQTLTPPRDFFHKSTYDDRELEKVLKKFAGVSSKAYQSMVEPGCRLSKQIGNTYTASVFANIVSLVDAHGASLEGQTALVFSYGSG